MPLNIPSSQQIVVNRVLSSMQNTLNNSNPFLKASFFSTIGIAYAVAIYDLNKKLELAVNQCFVDTATGTYLEKRGNLVKVNRLAASKAIGNITIQATAVVSIPSGTVYQTIDNVRYTTSTTVSTSLNVVNISSITRIAQTATVTTISNHNLASGISVTISGANEAEYNITAKIIVTSLTEFTYLVSGTPATPATGTIIATFFTASVEIRSVDNSASANQLSGTALSLSSPIANILNPAYVGYLGLTGGADIESDKSYRDRIIEKWQNPSPADSEADIIARAKEVPGVTRVFTSGIDGQITVYFLRDNDSSPIPTPGDIVNVKNKLLEKMSMTVNPANVFVFAPTPVYVNFTFSSITPNTETMKTSISNNLRQFFSTRTTVGQDVIGDAYRCAIFDTVDTETGEQLDSFFLTSPVSNIIVSPSEIALLGTVSF